MKRLILQVLQNLAFGVFVGIAVYGIVIYYGGEVQKRIPAKTSLLLGITAVLCVVVIVFVGGLIDKQAAMKKKRD
jgi:amino acid transporter